MRIEEIGATALLTAHARAEESSRPDRLFDDPWARVFVEAAAGTAENGLPSFGMARTSDPSELWVSFREYFTARTPFYDRCVLAAVDRGIRQVVLLAAGVDARAFRLDLPADTTVFELDSAPVLQFKQEILDRAGATPVCRRVCVPGDLREDWVSSLVAAGLRPGKQVLWVIEGLFMYLSQEQSNRLLVTITEQTRGGGAIATEYPARFPSEQIFSSLTVEDADRAAASTMASLVRTGPTVEPDTWLRRYGWTPDITDIATEISRSGRDVPRVFTDWTNGVPVWLLSGTRDAERQVS